MEEKKSKVFCKSRVEGKGNDILREHYRGISFLRVADQRMRPAVINIPAGLADGY